MKLIRVTAENIGCEHICCAISNEKDCQVRSKKAWLSERFAEGLSFVKGDVRGKCFIEYLPGEYAWAPVLAKGWMYIDCLWVAGAFKGQGWSNLLLDACIRDARAQGMHGLVALSSEKKLPFLSDPKHLKHKGFLPVDTAAPYFTLLCLPFDDAADRPRFVRDTAPVPQEGFTLYYTNQCPFPAKYVPLLLEAASARNVPLTAVHLDTREQAQRAPSPFTAFSLFYRGAFITHEMLNEKRFFELLDRMGFHAEAEA